MTYTTTAPVTMIPLSGGHKLVRKHSGKRICVYDSDNVFHLHVDLCSCSPDTRAKLIELLSGEEALFAPAPTSRRAIGPLVMAIDDLGVEVLPGGGHGGHGGEEAEEPGVFTWAPEAAKRVAHNSLTWVRSEDGGAVFGVADNTHFALAKEHVPALVEWLRTTPPEE